MDQEFSADLYSILDPEQNEELLQQQENEQILYLDLLKRNKVKLEKYKLDRVFKGFKYAQWRNIKYI